MVNAYTVLVVDDEPPILRFLRTSLTAVGHRVVTAENAAEALGILTVEKPDVVILDLGLPDQSGFDVITEIRKRSAVPIIVLSARRGELPTFVSGDLTVDLVRRHVTRDGQEVKLSAKEFELLRHLVAHAGKVLTHRHLLREVWGPAQVDEVQYLRVFIRGLRQKLEPDPTRPRHILTELGVGYRLQLPPEQRA
jgi:two-component system KDP operon response regulator KdpE